MRHSARRALPFLLALALLGPAQAQGGGQPFPGEKHPIKRLELKGATVVDSIRLISEISGLNVVSTEEAGKKKITLYLQNTSAAQAVETLCKVAGLWYRPDEDTGTYRVMTTEEYQKDHIVYRKDETRIFTMRHPNAIAVATAIEDLYGVRVELSLGVEEEEATDFPRGFGLDRSTGPGGTPFGTSNQVGSYGQTGRYGRDSVLRRSTMGRGRYGGSRTRVMDSERVIDETLTPDQIERLEERGTTDGAVTAEDLRGISRRDPTIYVTVNRQHNLIVVRTSDTLAMKEIAKLVAELDRPTPQVLLEMKILALTLGDSFRSIFDIEYTGGASSGGPETATPTNPLLPGQDTAPRSVLGSGNFDLEESTLVYQFLNDNVRARLQLLATDNRVDILATPIVLASNNRPARMFVGEERVLTVGISTDVITSATGPTTTAIAPITEIRDIGNTVLIVPKINADRTVTLMLVQDTSTVSEDSSNIPVPSGDGGVEDYPVDTVNTANLQATVVAKDGMTLAVGGLIRVELVDDLEKVPVLGDIPVVKFFFRKKVARRTKTELILLITPRVLFTPTEADEATRERLKANSDHPWVKQGDEAYRTDIDDLKRELDDEFKKEKKKKEEEQEDLEEAREEQETTK